MNLDRTTIITAALELPEDDRAEIVHELLHSLSSELNECNGEIMEDELDRRLAELDDGSDPGIPWSDLKREP